MAQPSLPARPDDAGRREDPVGGLNAGRGPWRQPVVWLGVAILLASLAGCVLMIVLAMGLPDESPSSGGDSILKMPVERVPAGPSR